MSEASSLEKTRNISIIAHIDHGKTTLSDYLLESAGLLPEVLAGSARALDSLEEEQKRGITIESNLVSLLTRYNGQFDYNINLIDTPGHIEFSGKVAEALRMVDGCLLIVDVVEGIMAQTSITLKQAMEERLQIILVLNKVDRLIIDLKLTAEEIQKRIGNIIASVRNNCKKYNFNGFILPSFQDNLVVICSAKHGWGIGYDTVRNHSHVSMKYIIDLYLSDNQAHLREEIPLSKLLITLIYDKIPNPIVAQSIKFPELIINKNEIPKKTIEDIRACNPEGKGIALIGKFQEIGSSNKYGSIVRVISGTLKRNEKIYSLSQKKERKIVRMFKKGTVKDESRAALYAGEIGVIVFSQSFSPGEIISKDKQILPEYKRIGYVQSPVLAMTIEPKKVKDFTKLPRIIEKITEAIPGLDFELNKETGELRVLGLGTLQFELLILKLEEQGIEIENTNPAPIVFIMPQKDATFNMEKWPQIQLKAGITSETQTSKRYKVLFKDRSNNQFLVRRNNEISNQAILGLKEAFRLSMRVSPILENNIKNLSIIILKIDNWTLIKDYEYGIMIGNSIIRESLAQTNSVIHKPIYLIEITSPSEYVGAILNYLPSLSASVETVTTEVEFHRILAKISIGYSIKLAQKLRALSEGKAFWNYTGVEFSPSQNSS